MRRTVLVIAFSILATPAAAQLRGSDYVTGLTNPVAFVQDPSAPERQFVVEQAGRIRVIRNGTLEAADFLDLRPVVGSGGERGLLGVATLGGHRPDVGAVFGEPFTASGYNLFVNGLPPGTWDIVVYVHSRVSGAFDAAQVVRVLR